MANAMILALFFAFVSSAFSPVYGQAGATPDKGMSVARHVVARSVQNQEPVEGGTSFPSDVGRLVFFTHLQNVSEPTTVTHVWMHSGRVVAEVPLKVGTPSWRTWSRKQILPEWKGEWKIDVKGTDGSVLATQSFTIQ